MAKPTASHRHQKKKKQLVFAACGWWIKQASRNARTDSTFSRAISTTRPTKEKCIYKKKVYLISVSPWRACWIFCFLSNIICTSIVLNIRRIYICAKCCWVHAPNHTRFKWNVKKLPTNWTTLWCRRCARLRWRY